MSYTQNPNQHPYPPQGAPQGYPQQPYPGQQAYGGPPQGHFNAPPPPQGGYPPAPSAHGYPQGPGYHPQQPHHGGPPQSQYPPPHGGPGYHPPAGGYQHPGPYGAPPPGQFQAPPSHPSIGYVDGQIAPGNFLREADLLRKAMKGFGTDENALIEVLSRLDPLQMAAVRQAYTNHHHRDLYNDVESETSRYFKMGLLAIIDGPLLHDVTSVREAIDGMGTKEWLLNDVLLGRSNADLKAIKNKYHQKYSRSLEKDVVGDLSSKTGTLFANVLRAERHEESYPVDPHTIEAEVRALHSATSGRTRNDTEEFSGIFARSSNEELRSINAAYKSRYNVSLENAIKKEFSGDVEAALLYILLTAVDPAKRDADLLYKCMKGAGTKDQRLVRHVVRIHWNKDHLDQVKRAYKHWYEEDLLQRVRKETGGDYEKLMLALLH